MTTRKEPDVASERRKPPMATDTNGPTLNLVEEVRRLYERCEKAESALGLLTATLKLDRNRAVLVAGDKKAWSDLDAMLDTGWIYSSRLWPFKDANKPKDWRLPLQVHGAGRSGLCDANLKDMTRAEVVELANRLARSRDRLYGCLMLLEGIKTYGPATFSNLCEAGRNELECRQEAITRCLVQDQDDFPPEDDSEGARDGE